jgi:uncharacterized damage-inducible protein DinB
MTTTTRSAVAAPIAMMFRVNQGLVARALDSLTDDELWRRPTDNNNPMLWIAGHVVQTRAALLKLLGEPFDTGWGDLFARGVALQDRARYPSRGDIDSVMRDVTARLHTKLAALDDEQLASPATGPVFPNAQTVADQIAFLALHESYHVGQLAYVRKALGYPALVG